MFLSLDGQGSLQRQAYQALRDAILAGRLAPGARLPSTRQLACELGVARNTVLLAYDRLVAEGYATTRPASGTFVVEALPAAALATARRRSSRTEDVTRLSSFGQRLVDSILPRYASWILPHEAVSYDFRYGEPAYNDLPLETWTRILGRRARRLSVRRLSYQPPGGCPELRAALAGYLARSRGVVCTPEQILIVHGSQQGIDLTTRLLVDTGDPVVLEEPHYSGFSFCLEAAGADVRYVAVDDQGLRTDELPDIAGVRLVYVTPSHQYPAGGVLSLPRRLALLDWAQARGAYVLEDDYDGEFRFAGHPLECLQALDRHGRVIYAGTASKIFFPAVRIGWLVVPPGLLDAFRSLRALADTGTATLEQLAFADFIADGHLERHVRRIRARHAARRAALLGAVARQLGGRAAISGTTAGLHVLLRLDGLSRRDVPALCDACRERGVGVYPAAPFYARPPSHAELLLGYGGLSEAAIREGIRRLAVAVEAFNK